jgi:hypothetical protein
MVLWNNSPSSGSSCTSVSKSSWSVVTHSSSWYMYMMVCRLTDVSRWLKRIGWRLCCVMGSSWTLDRSILAFLVVIPAVGLPAEVCMF